MVGVSEQYVYDKHFNNDIYFHVGTVDITVDATHYDDVIMGAMAFQITSLTIVYSTVNSDADQRKHQSSASLAIVSPHNWPVTRKKFPFHDVIMKIKYSVLYNFCENGRIITVLVYL